MSDGAELLDVVGSMAAALAQALDAFEALMAPGAEEGSPVDWPLPAALVLERTQLAAFVETMKHLPADVRDAVRAEYAVRITEAKQTTGYRDTAELMTSPVLPETKSAAAELLERLEEVRRAALFDRDLKEALRPVAVGRWTW